MLIEYFISFLQLQLSQAKLNATDAYNRAEIALQQANNYFNRTRDQINKGSDLIGNLTDILNDKTAPPEEIEKLANEVSSDCNLSSKSFSGNFLHFVLQTLSLNLRLDPEEIKALASKIDATVAQLENVDTIIYNTRDDLARVNDLKYEAEGTRFD